MRESEKNKRKKSLKLEITQKEWLETLRRVYVSSDSERLKGRKKRKKKSSPQKCLRYPQTWNGSKDRDVHRAVTGQSRYEYCSN